MWKIAEEIIEFWPPNESVLTFRALNLCAKYNKKAVLSQGNRAMPQLFFSI